MVTMDNYEEYLLLHADGELGQAEEKALEAFIREHPELHREMELYVATKILPDMEMVYEGKESLLKKPTRAIPLGQWKIYAAAACVAILVAIGLWKWNTADTTNINMVQITNNINITAPKDTFTGKQNTEDVAVTPQPKLQKTAAPSVPVPPKVHHYAAVEHKKTRPEQESIASLEVLPLKTMREIPATTMPKSLDVSIPETQLATTEPAEKETNALLARLPIRQEGISEIASAVNNKIERVRTIRNNIKNTDLSVRLWNTELFVVKL